MIMLVVIDESGDTGFKENSSCFFVMTMVVFKHSDGCGRYLAAEHTAHLIKEAMRETRHKPEFHFTACSKSVRISFF